jgi:hypothetical protein
MRALSVVFVYAVALLAGCAPSVQPGLANAVWLGGASPETRVHDVVANGRDACERSAFPQGGILWGQIPPCTPKDAYVRSPGFMPQPPPQAWPSPSYPFAACPRVVEAGATIGTSGAASHGFGLVPSEGSACRRLW